MVALTAGCLLPGALSAAPFCVSVTGLPDQCMYYDTAQCSARATQLGGVCTANPAELKVTGGSGRYCLVDSNRVAQCTYPDRDTCTADASRKGAICVDSLIVGVQPNLFMSNPEQRY